MTSPTPTHATASIIATTKAANIFTVMSIPVAPMGLNPIRYDTAKTETVCSREITIWLISDPVKKSIVLMGVVRSLENNPLSLSFAIEAVVLKMMMLTE